MINKSKQLLLLLMLIRKLLVIFKMLVCIVLAWVGIGWRGLDGMLLRLGFVAILRIILGEIKILIIIVCSSNIMLNLEIQSTSLCPRPILSQN